jgi:tripartite-type tricarboxylate transporter receptor subunit TctC
MMPDVPSSTEAGFPIPLSGWNSVAGPPNLPRYIQDRLHAGIEKVVARPEFHEAITAIGYAPLFVPAGESRRLVFEESTKMREIRTRAGLR